MSLDDVWNSTIDRAQTQRSTSMLSDGILWNVGNRQHSAQTLTKKQIMDLISAKKEAADKSRKDKKKKYFVDVDDEGECSIETTYTPGVSGWCYLNGSETALPSTPAPTTKSINKPTAQSAEAVTLKNVMVKATKKVAKKGAAKKVAHRTVSADRAATIKARTAGGKRVDISIGQMEANTKKGKVFYKDPQGVRQTLDGFKARANKDFVRKGMYEFKVTAE